MKTYIPMRGQLPEKLMGTIYERKIIERSIRPNDRKEIGRSAVMARWVMNTEPIETAIEKYVHERMVQGKQRASEHFLAYAYLKYGGDEVREFMKKAVGLSRYYINFLTAMENPFRGPELFWLASMLLVGIFSCYLMGLDDLRLLGIMVFSGIVVHAGALIIAVAKKWSQTGVMIAIYREIAEIAEHEVSDPA